MKAKIHVLPFTKLKEKRFTKVKPVKPLTKEQAISTAQKRKRDREH